MAQHGPDDHDDDDDNHDDNHHHHHHHHHHHVGFTTGHYCLACTNRNNLRCGRPPHAERGEYSDQQVSYGFIFGPVIKRPNAKHCKRVWKIISLHIFAYEFAAWFRLFQIHPGSCFEIVWSNKKAWKVEKGSSYHLHICTAFAEGSLRQTGRTPVEKCGCAESRVPKTCLESILRYSQLLTECGLAWAHSPWSMLARPLHDVVEWWQWQRPNGHVGYALEPEIRRSHTFLTGVPNNFEPRASIYLEYSESSCKLMRKDVQRNDLPHFLPCLASDTFITGPNMKPYETCWTVYLDQRRSQARHFFPVQRLHGFRVVQQVRTCQKLNW